MASIESKVDAEEAVQAALKLYLDDADGLDEPEDYMPIVTQAQELLTGALAYYRKANDAERTADVLETLSHIALRFGLGGDVAVPFLSEAAELYARLGLQEKAAQALTTLIQLDKPNLAKHRALLDQVNSAPDTEESPAELVKRAERFDAAGETEKAVRLFEKAAEAHLKADKPRPAAKQFIRAAELSLDRGRDDIAKEHFERARALAKSVGAVMLEAEALLGLMDVAEDSAADTSHIMQRLKDLKGRVSEDMRGMIDAYLM